MTSTSSDKGKPGESRRRKAMGLMSLFIDYDRQAAEEYNAECMIQPGFQQVRLFFFG